MPPDRLPNSARSEPTTPRHVTRAPLSHTLPVQLRGVVPTCAQQCLATYINQEYDCPSNDLDCLCREYSSEGYTLGELAYICYHQYCQPTTPGESRIQFDICNAKADAVLPTHSVLTVPPTSSSVSYASTTTEASPVLQTSTGSITKPSSGSNSHLVSHTSTETQSSGSMAQTTSTAQSPTMAVPAAADSATASPRSAGLTGPQAAGVAVACIGAVLLIAAAVFLFFCLRRRKAAHQGRKESFDFIDEAPPNFSHNVKQRAVSMAPPPTAGIRRFDRDTIRCWQQLALTNPASTYAKKMDDSPESVESEESTKSQSRLLPQRPQPAPTSQRLTILSPTAITAAASESTKRPSVVRTAGPGLPPNPRARAYPPAKPQPALPVQPRSLPTRPIRTPLEPRHPSLSLEIPSSPARPPPLTFPPAMPLPPTLAAIESDAACERRGSSTSAARSRDSSGSLLNYYSSADAGVVGSPEVIDSPTPIEPEVQRRKPVPTAITVTKPTHPPRAVRRDSNASDTSFESTDPDEPTPPEEDEKQLTPVQESPMPQTSPIADIRYPKIPRSANQTIPRNSYHKTPSPNLQQREQKPRRESAQKQYRAYKAAQDPPSEWPLPNHVTPDRRTRAHAPTPSLSGSTLAAKRRGNGIANNLELNLSIPHTAYAPFNHNDYPPSSAEELYPPRLADRRHESPLKGYGRVTSGGRKPSSGTRAQPQRKSPHAYSERQDVVPPSPYWEPKLTPKKRGDDLYLQVGIATPMEASFA